MAFIFLMGVMGEKPQSSSSKSTPASRVFLVSAITSKVDLKTRGFFYETLPKIFASISLHSYNVITPSKKVPIKNLSGGNVQRLMLARELSRNPRLIIANKPTRGLDVGSTEFIRRKLIESREKGSAVLVISEDLDEIFSLSDRIAVMYNGRITGIVPGSKANVEEIGLLMAGVEYSNRVKEPSL
jgi:ABC-type uncharacterized transport system ATPase subunit